jgi:hypothetical protein
MAKNTAAAIADRRQKLWTLLTRGMKTNEIVKELNTDHSISISYHGSEEKAK